MRDILHCDLNNFFASVECLKRPELKNVPMAVCGDPNQRHGIILAKNDIAKRLGIITAETIYSAKKKCSKLVLVEGHYNEYIKYSKIVNNIYLKYTDRVEPFGIDESFLDVTESKKLFGTPEEIAVKIKEEVKRITGLTISVGVSFNKSLAKLGSDLKKPDAVTILDYKNYKKKIYDLPVNMLLYVGKNTYNILKRAGIYTIGNLANENRNKITKLLGKLGETIHDYANGIDNSEVKSYTDIYIPKSISKGETFSSDVKDFNIIENKIRSLVNYITYKLRKYNLKTQTIGIVIKSKDFKVINRTAKIKLTRNYKDIVEGILELFFYNYDGGYEIRSITVCCSDLKSEQEQVQLSMFEGSSNMDRKIEKIEKVLDNINEKYNKEIIGFHSIN